MVTQRRWGSGLAAGEAAELLAAASVQFWRAPELTSLLAGKVAVTTQVRHAVVLAEGLRAAAHGAHRGGLDTVLHAIDVANEAGERELEAVLRIRLAEVARLAGLPKVALAVLRPTLVAGRSSGVLGVALATAAVTLAPLRWRDELYTVLVNAERLCVLDDRLDVESSALVRADVLAAAAASLRAGGDLVSAAAFARDGLRALDGLPSAAAAGTGRVAALQLELLLALSPATVEGAELAQLIHTAERGVFEPVRAPAAAPTAWLAHALATGIGDEDRGRSAAVLLAEAVHIAERHEEYGVLAASARELAVLQEQAGVAGAARSVRTSDFAAARHRRRFETIRAQLVDAYPGERPRSIPDEDAPFTDELEGAAAEWIDIGDLDKVIDEVRTFAVEIGGYTPSYVLEPDVRQPSESTQAEAGRAVPAAADGYPSSPQQGAGESPPAEPDHAAGLEFAPDTGENRPVARNDVDTDRDAASAGEEPATPPAESNGARFDLTRALELMTAGLPDDAEEEPDAAPRASSPGAEGTPAGLAHVAGLRVTEGSGGRRRAPESQEPGERGGAAATADPAASGDPAAATTPAASEASGASGEPMGFEGSPEPWDSAAAGIPEASAQVLPGRSGSAEWWRGSASPGLPGGAGMAGHEGQSAPETESAPDREPAITETSPTREASAAPEGTSPIPGPRTELPTGSKGADVASVDRGHDDVRDFDAPLGDTWRGDPWQDDTGDSPHGEDAREHSGPEHAGPEHTGPECTGRVYSGPEHAGLEYTGHEDAVLEYVSSADTSHGDTSHGDTSHGDTGHGDVAQENESREVDQPDETLGFADLLAQAMDAYHDRSRPDHPTDVSEEPPGQPAVDTADADRGSAFGWGASEQDAAAQQDAAAPDVTPVESASTSEAPPEPHAAHGPTDFTTQRRHDRRRSVAAGADTGEAELNNLASLDEHRQPRHRKPDSVTNGFGGYRSGAGNGSRHGKPADEPWHAERFDPSWRDSAGWDSAGSAD